MKYIEYKTMYKRKNIKMHANEQKYVRVERTVETQKVSQFKQIAL